MKQVFLSRSTIDEDWERFVQRERIPDPEGYLEEAVLPYENMTFLEMGISTVCNFDCPFCFNHYSPSLDYYTRAEIPGPKVVEVVKANTPINEIQFAVCGEPLLHGDFFQILEAVAPHVGGIRISTNGSLLTRHAVDRLRQFRITWISVSAEASDKRQYERFRRNGNFEAFKRHIAYLQDSFPGKVSFTSVLCNENRQSVLGLPGLCRELGGIAHIHLLDAVIHPEHSHRGLRRLTDKEIRDFMIPFLDSCEQNGVQPGWFQRLMKAGTAEFLRRHAGDRFHVDPGIYRSPCWIPFSRLNVDPEGNFNSCCSVDPKPGNALGRPFRELFNDPQTLKLRVLNLLQAFPRICRRYCHKVPNSSVDSSLENFRRLLHPIEQSSSIWSEIAELPPGVRVLGWPCGTLTRTLIDSSFFSRVDLVGLADSNPELWGKDHRGVRIFSPQEALSLDIDAVLITTGTYQNEILNQIDQTIGLSSKEVFMIGLDQKLKRYERVP